jgi:hypothetical protein
MGGVQGWEHSPLTRFTLGPGLISLLDLINYMEEFLVSFSCFESFSPGTLMCFRFSAKINILKI